MGPRAGLDGCKKSRPPPGFDPRTVQPVASPYTNWANPAHFDKVEEFKYLETILTNQNSIQEEIKNRLKSRNACYHLVQNLLSSSFLSKNIKIKKHRTKILHVVLYGFETWSLTPREEHRLTVFENRVLRRIFGPKRDKVIRGWRKLHN